MYMVFQGTLKCHGIIIMVVKKHTKKPGITVELKYEQHGKTRVIFP